MLINCKTNLSTCCQNYRGPNSSVYSCICFCILLYHSLVSCLLFHVRRAHTFRGNTFLLRVLFCRLEKHMCFPQILSEGKNVSWHVSCLSSLVSIEIREILSWSYSYLSSERLVSVFCLSSLIFSNSRKNSVDFLSVNPIPPGLPYLTRDSSRLLLSARFWLSSTTAVRHLAPTLVVGEGAAP